MVVVVIILLCFGGALGVAGPPPYNALDHIATIEREIANFNSRRDLSCLDMFGGSGNFAHVFGDAGYKSIVFDMASGGEAHNIITKDGFFTALRYVLRLKVGGLMPSGPPCSMFVFMSSSLHRRSLRNPEGDTRTNRVKTANIIVYNFLVLACVATMRRVYTVIEQPSSTRMFDLAKMIYVIGRAQLVRVFTWMGKFGHARPKPTILYGNLPCIGDLTRKWSRAASVRGKPNNMWYVTSNGWVRGSSGLKKSAVYARRFVRAVCKV